ncbi:DUF4181 domain-containing protein [Paenibacillus wynnii]|uniref:DUF4181 domain-containing protein n=1 Tax=Paenibacillus wynnii TaxID=268407 RepID=UPI0035937EDD
MGYFLISLSFRAFMEWKYKREEKEYILTLYSMFIFCFGPRLLFNLMSNIITYFICEKTGPGYP